MTAPWKTEYEFGSLTARIAALEDQTSRQSAIIDRMLAELEKMPQNAVYLPATKFADLHGLPRAETREALARGAAQKRIRFIRGTSRHGTPGRPVYHVGDAVEFLNSQMHR